MGLLFFLLSAGCMQTDVNGSKFVI